MRTFTFTLLAIAAGTAVQIGLDHLPYGMDNALGKFVLVLMLALPMAATIGVAYATRIDFIGYVYFLAIVSPFLSWVLMVLFSVWVLHEPFYI